MGFDFLSISGGGVSDFLHQYREIMSTEAEGIAQGDVYIAFLCLVESHVQSRIKLRIIRKVVDGRRDHRLVNCEQACDRFNRPGGAEQVTSH